MFGHLGISCNHSTTRKKIAFLLPEQSLPLCLYFSLETVTFGFPCRPKVATIRAREPPKWNSAGAPLEFLGSPAVVRLCPHRHCLRLGLWPTLCRSFGLWPSWLSIALLLLLLGLGLGLWHSLRYAATSSHRPRCRTLHRSDLSALLWLRARVFDLPLKGVEPAKLAPLLHFGNLSLLSVRALSILRLCRCLILWRPRVRGGLA